MSHQTSGCQTEQVGDRSVVRETYDWDATAPSAAVVETVADVVGRDPTEIGPLYDSVDPDALDSLFTATGSSPTCGDGYVSFAFAGRSVAVHADGDVIVRSPVGSP